MKKNENGEAPFFREEDAMEPVGIMPEFRELKRQPFLSVVEGFME
jgi:hypothetical protein